MSGKSLIPNSCLGIYKKNSIRAYDFGIVQQYCQRIAASPTKIKGDLSGMSEDVSTFETRCSSYICVSKFGKANERKNLFFAVLAAYVLFQVFYTSNM